MKGLFTFLLSVSLVLAVTLFCSNSALAHHRAKVLGDATASSQLVFPPITSGQGFILPDSPFFFLDRLSQKAKLFFAFSSEQKAKVRAQIAGERLAELRIMLERQNPQGINIALSHLTEEIGFAAKDLSDAAAQGSNVKVLAKKINEDIKFQRKLLNLLADQTSGLLKRQLKTAREALKEAKVEVEDELPGDELENEIEEGLNDEVENEIDEASESEETVERALTQLEIEASKSAAKALHRREEAISHAVEKRNEVLRKEEEKLLEIEKKKQEKLFEAHKKAVHQAKKAMEKAHEARKEFKKAHEAVMQIKHSGLLETDSLIVPEPNDSMKNDFMEKELDDVDSSDSGSSGSGSSGSSESGDSDRSGSNSGKE